MSADQRQALIDAAPLQVGNTDGVPWDLRIAANRVNIANAIKEQQHLLDRPAEEKVRDALARGFDRRLDPFSAERIWSAAQADPRLSTAAVAYHDWDANRRITFYQGLLSGTPDPTGRSSRSVDRQILAFDPKRYSLIELTGDLETASSVGVMVPGMGTTILDSGANTETARRFVAAGGGDVAMITYLGGRFPTGGTVVTALAEAADPRYATDMAPRLVAFSEDVNRTVDATGRHIPVTYIGHSYGGSILGTAERLGMTADRTVYVEAAGAGVGVHDESDWHNRNPDVVRATMTAPADLISLVQGLPLGPHGADPDELKGVVHLPTGLRLDGTIMSGPSSHSDVLNEPSDAWQNILDVITGRHAWLRVKHAG
jgi:Alpha/beta hydrolase